VSNIDRALRILAILASEPRGVRVTDLATKLNLNRAIPHRLLAELVELGYVVQDPGTERYRATFELGSLGLRQLETAGVSRWAQDELDSLARASRELVRLAVASGSDLRWVAKAQGANSALIIDPIAGSEVVLHATATGKAWLSTLPHEQVVALLNERGLDVKTPHTETSLDSVLDEVAAARERGYALTYEEMEAGINAIAAPILPAELGGQGAAGTVSIAGPAARLTPEILTSFAPLILATTRRLAEQWHVYEYLVAVHQPTNGTTAELAS
jgi:DNA-binding IclR family transcriptional regulator